MPPETILLEFLLLLKLWDFFSMISLTILILFDQYMYIFNIKSTVTASICLNVKKDASDFNPIIPIYV